MASHYIALNRGQEGLTTTDFVLGAASAGNAGLEVRLDYASGYRKITLCASPPDRWTWKMRRTHR